MLRLLAAAAVVVRVRLTNWACYLQIYQVMTMDTSLCHIIVYIIHHIQHTQVLIIYCISPANATLEDESG